jgi:hypothetical protein
MIQIAILFDSIFIGDIAGVCISIALIIIAIAMFIHSPKVIKRLIRNI